MGNHSIPAKGRLFARCLFELRYIPGALEKTRKRCKTQTLDPQLVLQPLQETSKVPLYRPKELGRVVLGLYDKGSFVQAQVNPPWWNKAWSR